MDSILDIARRHNLLVVEDACHGWGATWKDRKVGAIGDMGGVSFQASKHITAGEGGVVLTNDEEHAAKCFSYHHIGRIPGRPFYEHHLVGWNFRMTEFDAAVLLVQLERLEEQTQRRADNADFLCQQLSGIEGVKLLRREPYMTRIAWHTFSFNYDAEGFGGASREKFLSALSAEGIPVDGGYSYPLYENPLFAERRFGHIAEFVDFPGYREAHCPNCERLCRERVSISQACLIGTLEDMRDIVRAVEKIRENIGELGMVHD